MLPNWAISFCAVFSPTPGHGNVIGGIAHQPQHINDLSRRLDVELGFHFGYAHYLEFLIPVFRPVHKDIVRDQLAIVFIGCHHIGSDALSSGFGGKGAYNVIGFVSTHFEDRDAVGSDDVFNDRHREADDFGSLFALGFVVLTNPIMAEVLNPFELMRGFLMKA